MRYRIVPETDLSVSEIGFGVWTVSTTWWGVTDDETRRRLLRTAVDKHGINFINTADTYGDGLGETIVRDVLGDRRDELVIATKFGYDLSDDSGRPGHRERRQDFSPAGIRASCDASLQRLGTDHIDLYEAHNPRIDAIDSDEVVGTLQDLQAAGKIRYFGTALGPRIEPSRQVDEGVATFERGWHTCQIIYNLLEQYLHERIFDAAHTHNRGILVRVPHSSGLLEGNLTPETTFPKWDHRSHRPEGWLTEGLHKVDQLDFLVNADRTIAQAALKFVLHDDHVCSALPNVYDMEQLAEFAGTSDAPHLTEDEMRRIGDLYKANFGLATTSA